MPQHHEKRRQKLQKELRKKVVRTDKGKTNIPGKVVEGSSKTEREMKRLGL